MDRIRDIRPPGSPHAVYPQAQRVVERLLAKTTAGPNGCIIWTGYTDRDNYGDIKIDGKHLRVHRAVYQLLVSPLPTAAQVDHSCHNADANCPGGPTCLHRRCLNPHHLDAVTNRENNLRSAVSTAGRNFRKTHCWRGHAFTAEHSYVDSRGHRICRTCARIRYSAWQGRQRSAARGQR